jgi:hypothetical protein
MESSHLGLAVATIGGTLIVSTVVFSLFYILIAIGIVLTPWYQGNVFPLLKKRELYAIIGYFFVLLGALLSTWGLPALKEEYLPYVYFSVELLVLVFLALSIIGSWTTGKKL